MSITVNGRIFVELGKANKVPSMDIGTESDCFVIVRVGNHQVAKSKVIDNNNNPVWNEHLYGDAEVDIGGNVVLELWDSDSFTKNDYIGAVTIPFKSVPLHREEPPPQTTAKIESRHSNDATLTYSISFRKFSWEEDFAQLQQANQQLKDSVAQLHEENAKLQSITNELKLENDKFAENNKVLHENVSKFTEENEKLHATANELRSEVAQLHQVREELQTNVNKFSELNGKLEGELADLKQQNQIFSDNNNQLKENVENFKAQNAQLKVVSDNLREENENFHREVDRLSHSIAALETVKQTIEVYAEKNKDDFQHIIDKLNATLDSQKEVLEQQKSVLQQTKLATKQQEKILLLQLQSQCQYVDRNIGLSVSEFQLFLNLIPKKFLQLPVALEFSKIDKDHDGTIDINEFNALIDSFLLHEE